MISEVINNFLRFVGLILIQGLIINELELGTLIVPYIYLLFIMRLPFETPKWLVLFLSFFCGVVMDAFTNTPGLHISTCVFLGFMRPSILRLYAPRDGYEYGMQPTIKSMGVTWFLLYALWMVLLFHFWFFYLEVFSMSGFFNTFLRVLLSSFFAFIMIVLSQFLTIGGGSRK